jgi:hypothetical protein
LFKALISSLLILLALNSCKQREVDGIVIDQTLYENQSLSDNKELRQIIQKTINKDEKALAKLCDFGCGQGAGCYDLGFIITQIIYKIGEKEFSLMVLKLSKKQVKAIEGLVITGLEYGDNNNDGKMDNKRIENEFPELNKCMKLNLNEHKK